MSEAGRLYATKLAKVYDIPLAEESLFAGERVSFSEELVIPFRNTPQTALDTFSQGLNDTLAPAFTLQQGIAQRHEGVSQANAELVRDSNLAILPSHLKLSGATTGQVKDFHVELVGLEEMPYPKRQPAYLTVTHDIIPGTEFRFLVTARVINVGAIACGLGVDVLWKKSRERPYPELYARNRAINLPRVVRRAADLAKLNRGLATLRDESRVAKRPYGNFEGGKRR